MKAIYFDNNDTLFLRLSDKPIIKDVSQDWHTQVSYADDGSAVEVLIRNAKALGMLPTIAKQDK